ncbi:flagellar hook-length control protein FliK [Helicobacter salomonis]|uniref:flagellar hook-length control protein FliK n=1 Tax=Helicobacter salomonis TaxID=56878 RepID=UPI000CF058C4|nr:flagellar hook-length control protein FliK [Helicobacter salomonis]
MALNPINLEAAKAPSKGKAPSTHKAILEDKDAFKQLLSNKKNNLKALADLKTRDSKKHALPLKSSPHAKEQALPADMPTKDKKASKGKQSLDITQSPLAHLLDTKMVKLPDSTPRTSEDALLAQKVALSDKDLPSGKMLSNSKDAKLSDIQKLESAKKLGLSKLKHEKKVSKTPKGSTEIKEKTLPTQSLLEMQEKPKSTLKGGKETSPAPKQAEEIKDVLDSAPKPTTKSAQQTPTPPKTPLTQLLGQQTTAQQKQNLAKVNAQKIYGHTLPKDNETNDKEIKQAFKEALAQFPPSIYAPHAPLHGPAKPTLEETKEEKSSVAIKESASHTAIQHTQDKELPKAPQIKETLKNFATELKQELQNFKPPISRLSMELHPDKLGKVDVVIQQVGKNIQVSVASSAPVAALLSSYNNELRHNLAQMGFSDVDVSFIAHNNAGHGGSGHSQQQQQGQAQGNPSQNSPATPTPPKDTNAPPSESSKSAGLYA